MYDSKRVVGSVGLCVCPCPCLCVCESGVCQSDESWALTGHRQSAKRSHAELADQNTSAELHQAQDLRGRHMHLHLFVSYLYSMF